jgi:hypothetical protein
LLGCFSSRSRWWQLWFLRWTKIAFFLHLWKKKNLQYQVKSQCCWVNYLMSKKMENGSIEMKSRYIVLMYFLGGGCSWERFAAI